MHEIDIDQAAAVLQHGGCVIDVREPTEYEAGHVPGAVNLPSGRLPDALGELDRSAPVHVICASGNRSAVATDLLQSRGFHALNVRGGTNAWVRSRRPVVVGADIGVAACGAEAAPSSGLTVLTIETPGLGDRSYLVHDGEVAFVVDPQRDIDRVLELLHEHDVRLTHVFETHIHNDYVTGGFALAQRTGAQYLVNGEDDVSFVRVPLANGQVVKVGGRMRVTALATPGHTFTHLSYALTEDRGGAEHGLAHALGVFSGGSLLYGATGRPDLLGAEHTHDLVRHQYASARRLARVLPDQTEVYPTHGFGSFCAASQSDATSSTIGRERQSNPVLTQDEQTFVDELLAGLGPWPAYYAHMARANLDGPSEPDLSLPVAADATELRRRIEAGEWVVDLRNRTAFAAGHAPGTLNVGLDGGFATYLGWLVAWGAPVTLLGETTDDVVKAQRELVRIGIDRPSAYASGGPEQWSDRALSAFPTATFADLAQVRHRGEVVVLDVRRADEHHSVHIDGAVNLPLHELTARLGELPPGEVWVHCAGGYRASVAASLLAAAGHTAVAIDDSFDNTAAAGLPLVGPQA